MNFERRGLHDFSATRVEALGAEASYGNRSRTRATREVLLRLVVEHASREALEIFARELGSVGLSCAPGTTGIYNGRPKPTPVVRLFTFLIDKRELGDPVVTIGSGPAQRRLPSPRATISRRLLPALVSRRRGFPTRRRSKSP